MITKSQADRIRAKANRLANTAVEYEKALIRLAMKEATHQDVFIARTNYDSAVLLLDRHLKGLQE